MSVTLEPARWPGGPLICPAVNLPSFQTQGDAADFLGKLCGVALVKWHCKECGGWHFWAKPNAPAGESSGTARVYHVPYHVLKLIRETRHLAPERERAQPLSIPLNTRVNYDEDPHPKFQRNLIGSEPCRKRVKAWLERLGYSVYMPPLKVAAKRDQWAQCVDSGDLFVTARNGVHRIEVKQRFGKNSFSVTYFPHDSLIVVHKPAYERADPKPLGFINLNESMEAAAIVWSNTREHWFEAWIPDSRYNNEAQLNYLCPISKVLFVPYGHPLKLEEIQPPPESTAPAVPTLQYLSTGQSKLPWDDPSFMKWAKHENQ